MSNLDATEQNKITNKDKTITKHQQQILFAETELFPPKNPLADTKQQIIFDNQDLMAIDDGVEDDNELLMQDIKLTSKPRWVWRIVLSLLSVMVCVETFNFFIAGFTASPISTSIYGIILAGLTFIAGGALWRELTGLRQLKHQQILKAQAIEALADETPINVEQFCQQLSKNLPCDLRSSQQDKWLEALKGEYSDSELLQLYSKLVLSDVDKKVIAEISKFSTEAVVLVALSPVALIDMFVMLWRNLRMLDKISGLYGLKLGYWSRIKLIKQVFINMAYAGASELIADFGTEMVGADLLGKMSARLAQGLGAGLLTSRLGLKAMHLCRPLPFDDNSPKLTEVRKEILSQLKSLVKK